MKTILSTYSDTHKHTQSHVCIHTHTHTHTHVESLRQMANGWWMNQTVRVIFRCNGAVNDSALLECYRILHKLQCMRYQLVWETEEFILVWVAVRQPSLPASSDTRVNIRQTKHQSFALKLGLNLAWPDWISWLLGCSAALQGCSMSYNIQTSWWVDSATCPWRVREWGRHRDFLCVCVCVCVFSL